MLMLLARYSLAQQHFRSMPSLISCSKTGLFKQGGVFKGLGCHENLYSCNFACKLNTSNNLLKEELSISEKVKHELSIFKSVDFKQLKCAPFPAILYGFGGVIPFIFPPLYFIVGSFSPFLATSQLMYGATILAFVGGVKWGNALAKEDISHEQIGMSTIPSLVAWSSLMVPEPIGYILVSSGLLGALYLDLVSSRYPPWFCALRCSLTGTAVLSLMISFICTLLH